MADRGMRDEEDPPTQDMVEAAQALRSFSLKLSHDSADVHNQPPAELDIPKDEPLLGVDRYRKLRDLGRGRFGIVQLAVDNTTGEQVAIKFVQPGDGSEQINRFIRSEILNHRKLRHPCVIAFKEVFTTSRYIGIVMEYASGGNLYTHLQAAPGGHFQEAAARWFFQQLIIGLDYCHHLGVVNRDIKLNNTLVQLYPGQQRLPDLKLADFGYSKAIIHSNPKTKVGTLPCMAPELLRFDRSNASYDGKKTDIWSCGVMLYHMLFGRHPFIPSDTPPGSNEETVRRAIRQRVVAGKWSLPDDIPVSPGCQDLLQHLLLSDPVARLSVEQIYRHPWFLTDLPEEADAVRLMHLQPPDLSGLQSEQEIKHILDQVL